MFLFLYSVSHSHLGHVFCQKKYNLKHMNTPRRDARKGWRTKLAVLIN